ncbi:zinc-binding dehydrogenase [Nocardioides sp. Kera G14]|uniref:zinc-binding dehydrogenase n=1 Tax=Nocardioides sp. Kera G14 TaxID=2884264 RepID=UPI001D12BE7D|nr:zinc-binding dehydrogenase [Nocardioides sp. Kera G14]UDY23568.1 zinc-binding dehydrogenase [Nocardioides sp. Kera G14]
MKAVVCQDGELSVTTVTQPQPGPGQLLVKVVRAGICGSDLHARTHAAELAEIASESGYPGVMAAGSSVVFGHELVGEVVAYGPQTRGTWKPGTLVTALPVRRDADGTHLVGFEEGAPGAYAEYTVVQEAFTFEVPEGLEPDLAAFTEPLAVAWHAVRRAKVGKRPVIVIGCGPIGLAIILMLRAAGAKKIIASDFSPARRRLAEQCGATTVVDPREESPWDVYRPTGPISSPAAYAEYGIKAVGAARRVPFLPWEKALLHAELLGQAPQGPVVFECVGIPGMIEQIVTAAPIMTRLVVVGVCMEPDSFRPAAAINKEIEIRFAFGYDPAEFNQTLGMIASGKVDPSPLHTGTVGLEGVSKAFTDLGNPEVHAKILIDPSL